MLGLTSKLALLLLVTLAILMIISSSIFIIAINNIVCQRLKIEKRNVMFGILVLSSLILWAINLIPFVGSLVGFVANVLGLGMIVSNIVLKEKEAK